MDWGGAPLSQAKATDTDQTLIVIGKERSGGCAGPRVRRPSCQSQVHWITESFEYNDGDSDYHSRDHLLCVRDCAKHFSLNPHSHTMR